MRQSDMSPFRSLSPSGKGGGRRSHKTTYIILAAIAVFAFLFWTPLPSTYEHQRHELVTHVAGGASKGPSSPHGATLKDTKSKYAFATLLAGDSSNLNDPDNLNDDYFIATRLLGYQLMHAPETRTNGIPFLVLATKKVSEKKLERLRLDGAIVLPVETVEKPAWIAEGLGAANWAEMFDKLRLWELTQFDRICFLDGDTVLNRPLDGIFNDTAVAEHKTLDHPERLKSDEGSLPSTYVFAGQPEMNFAHHYPPSEEQHDYPNINYLNGGFFVMQPSLDILNYYFSIMQLPNRFPPKLQEQNLLNYAHRSEKEGGNMPWKMLGSSWNLHYPTMEDVKGGVASLHEKWWAPVDKELSPLLKSWRWRMEGFYEAMDGLRYV
ncbi:hypothetical protein Q7P37_005964 [Cladosporium fusiforme]